MDKTGDELGVNVPSYEELSDPDSVFFDHNWFELDCVPFDDPWSQAIGEFLYMRSMISQYKYNGSNPKLERVSENKIKIFEGLLADIEELIRYRIESIEFAEKWAELCRAYDGAGFVKRTQKERTARKKKDPYREQRRAWFAVVFLRQKAKGLEPKEIRYDIAKYAELIKEGVISKPYLWDELEFHKVLSKGSSLKDPKLNKDLGAEFTISIQIPLYAKQEAPKYDLPPFDVSIPDSY